MLDERMNHWINKNTLIKKDLEFEREQWRVYETVWSEESKWGMVWL